MLKFVVHFGFANQRAKKVKYDCWYVGCTI